MENEILRNVMKIFGCEKKEASQLIKSEIKTAKGNFHKDGNLYQAVGDCLHGLGLESDYEIWFAERIAF